MRSQGLKYHEYPSCDRVDIATLSAFEILRFRQELECEEGHAEVQRVRGQTLAVETGSARDSHNVRLLQDARAFLCKNTSINGLLFT